jgi:hypothetical protein
VKVAVVGHVEWIEFARVERVPAPGEVAHALEGWEEPGGGGAVAAVRRPGFRVGSDASAAPTLAPDCLRTDEPKAARGRFSRSR